VLLGTPDRFTSAAGLRSSSGSLAMLAAIRGGSPRHLSALRFSIYCGPAATIGKPGPLQLGRKVHQRQALWLSPLFWRELGSRGHLRTAWAHPAHLAPTYAHMSHQGRAPPTVPGSTASCGALRWPYLLPSLIQR
jgi:hypothetical protein